MDDRTAPTKASPVQRSAVGRGYLRRVAPAAAMLLAIAGGVLWWIAAADLPTRHPVASPSESAAPPPPTPSRLPVPTPPGTAAAPTVSQPPATIRSTTVLDRQQADPVEQTQIVAVPAVAGLSADEARTALARRDLVVGGVTHWPDDTAVPGTVLRTLPREGVQVIAGTVVELVVAVPNGATAGGGPPDGGPSPSVGSEG